jgi:two-component system NtrC family sensor kinase
LTSYFENFFARIGEEGGYFAMVRDDGQLIARYPVLPTRRLNFDDDENFQVRAKQGVDDSFYTTTSPIDNTTRRNGIRKVPGFPVYVIAGVEWNAIISEWLHYNINYLIFGLPLTVLLSAGLGLALRRTRHLYDEAERREVAEGALRQAQRLEAIGQLTGGVAHDFNNLLMVISGSLQRLRSQLTDSKYMRPLDMIATATQRGETLTRQLLTYSRRQTLSPEVVDLRERLPLIRELLTRSLRTDIHIKVEVPDTACAVHVDPGEFELAILNLAINAKDAMPHGGSLSIRARPVTLKGEATAEGLTGDFVAVRIADTGHGIPADLMNRVFEPFFTTKEVGKGTGLGLSQVYGFAKQSGGTATVSSTEGRGTTVTLFLPRSHQQPEVFAPAEMQVPAQAETAGTVLLVEDNDEVAEVSANYMRQLGYRVRSVANVQAALAALQLDPQVDLVFSDILMPGGRNGLQLAREIEERFPDIPVLLTTGYSAGAQDAVRYGVIVLQKPYNLEALRRHIHEAAERAKSRHPNIP